MSLHLGGGREGFQIMKYNFDEIVSREGTDSYKTDRLSDVCNNPDAIPMWVADMEFRTPPFVIDVLHKRADQGIIGYTCSTPAYREAICQWNKRQYGNDVQPEYINYVPGVVSGIFLAVNALTEKGDKVLIQQPVYHPFRLVPEACGRELVFNQLRRTTESFEMDFDALRRDLQGCRLMVLCNPHNPAGICWSRETLQKVAHLAAEAGTIVVSDEIHCDMCFDRQHIPFATVSDEARENSITLTAPTKTFNLPGIVASQAIVYNSRLRERYFSYIEGTDQDLGNVFAYDCVRACYSEEGDNWRRQMLAYVRGNIDLLCERLAKECPRIRPIRPEASYLVFLDCREMGLEQDDLISFFCNEAGIALNNGDMFGESGKGYMRMNLGCPRSMLDRALNQLRDAYKKRF